MRSPVVILCCSTLSPHQHAAATSALRSPARTAEGAIASALPEDNHLKQQKSPFVPCSAKGGALCLRAVPATAQPQNSGSGARRGEGFVWYRIALARMGRKVSILHPTPSLPVMRPALSRAHPESHPPQLSCYANAERREARWEGSAVAPPLPCWPQPAGLLGLRPEGFLISVCACDCAGLECEQ